MKIVDDTGKEYIPQLQGNRIVLTKESFNPGVRFVEVRFPEWEAAVGDPGYYVIADCNNRGSHLCHFTEKEEKQLCLKQNLMPIVGVKLAYGCFAVVVNGMSAAFYVNVGLQNGIYRIAARFYLDEEIPYEDISFEIADLGQDADYADIANYYRNYKIRYGGCTPLAQRVKNNPYLAYSAESVQIRIRMGWKPAPSPVMEQTRDNEPEMKVACTFDRVKDIIDELKKQGVDQAELCLVGWNKSGHDGRWPELFPVEEKLGGEKKLRELIGYAQNNGYQITCHTNSTDCYHIAEDFCHDIVQKRKDGSLVAGDIAWSGGRMYHLCPVRAAQFAERDLPRVAQLGFRGTHYIDVISVDPLRKCYDANHPATPADTASCYRQIGNLSKKLFGGFSSEGAFDFTADYLDYALYVSFGSNQEPFFDREIPLWQMVYHGIVLSNPSTETLNYPVKPAERKLKLIEYGGRPTFYFYSKFMENSDHSNWLGREDLICDTDEQLQQAVRDIASAYEEYKSRRHLQYEHMTKHMQKEPGVFEVTYSDHTVVQVDYNSGHYVIINPL